MNLHSEQITQWLRPRLTVGMDARLAPLQRVHTDSRSLQPGDLFVALRGAHFDANDFLPQAAAAGAVAALCQGEHAAQRLAQAGLPGWVVADTRAALAELARRWRAQWAGSALIAVTGSNGKTTVTQMLASILRSAYGAAAHATRGNLNNDIGVPLTVLGLRGAHRAAVVELGMNHPGEIAQLAAIAQPTVALVNNAQREHLEFMHTVQAVAAENGAVLAALPTDGVAVFPADDAHARVWADLAATRRVLRFATQPGVDAEFGLLQAQATPTGWQVRARTPEGALDFALAVAGTHNLHNALAALACAWGAGVPAHAIAAGLAAFEPVAGRSRTLRLQHQARALTLVDDSYNANPDSVAAAIELLAALPGPRLLVLGDMGEVGDQGPRFHAEALQHALQINIEKVLVTGSAFAVEAPKFDSIEAFDDGASLNAAVVAALPGVRSVLVKGSRFMKMERVVAAIQAACAQTPAEATC